MNRRKPLERKTQLARGEKPLKRTRLKAGAPKRRQAVPKAIKDEVARRSRGRCIVCAWNGKETAGTQRHHVLPVQSWPELELHPDNMVLVCAACHDDHERANRRIPRPALPAAALKVAAVMGAEWYVEKTYPATVRPVRELVDRPKVVDTGPTGTDRL